MFPKFMECFYLTLFPNSPSSKNKSQSRIQRWNGNRSRKFCKNHLVKYICGMTPSSSKWRLIFGIVVSRIFSQIEVKWLSFGNPGKNIPFCVHGVLIMKEQRAQNAACSSLKIIINKAAIALIPFFADDSVINVDELSNMTNHNSMPKNLLKISDP